MEGIRIVHIGYKLSGENLAIVRKESHYEWTTFVSALHYYAARACGIPVWCVHLIWRANPWDEAQLPMNVYIGCVRSWEFPEIGQELSFDGRCMSCLEDCEDAYERRIKKGLPMFSPILPDAGEENCGNCETTNLCDLCRVLLKDGGCRCLLCFHPPEYTLASLSKAQRIRWLCVNSLQS